MSRIGKKPVTIPQGVTVKVERGGLHVSAGLLWLLTMIPVLDCLAASKSGRAIAMTLLGFSILSAHYSLWNPWRHPWIFDLMIAAGWPGY